MNLRLILTSVCILTLSGGIGASPGREMQHQSRMTGLDLRQRSLAESTNSRQTQSLLASLDDYAISQSVAPATFSQDNAGLIGLASGGWLAVWQDDRQGAYKIFGQEIDSLGQLVGPNIVLAGSSVGASYVEPRVDADALGRIYLAYRDQTNGLVFATRLSPDLQVDLPAFLVNDTSQSSFAGPHDLAVFPDGTFVLVWENYSVLGSTIQFRLYSPSGSDLVGPETVNSDGGASNHWVPAVAVAPTSGFLVAWEDYRNGRADTYARPYTGSGVAQGTEFSWVPPPQDASNQFNPSLTWSPKDQYVIGWEDHRLGQELYLQRFHPVLGLQGGNSLISSGLVQVQNGNLHLSSIGDGQISATWSASGADNTIQNLELDSGLVPAALPDIMNLGSLGQRWGPGLSESTTGRKGVAWSESTASHSDIVFMPFDNNGSRLLPGELTLNDDAIGAHSTRPAMVWTSDWVTLVAYVDQRFDDGDIFVRGIYSDGAVPGGEWKLNQDTTGGVQSEPSLASTVGGALATWIDGRTFIGSSGQRVFGRFCSRTGAPSGPEFLISDSSEIGLKSDVDAATLPNGEGLVAWIDQRQTSPQVYGRLINSSGLLSTSDQLLSSLSADSSAAYLTVVTDDSSRYYVVWLDIGLTDRTVKVRRYDQGLNELASFLWSSTIPGVEINELAADVHGDGTISLVWGGFQSGGQKLFLTQLSGDGLGVITPPLEITDDPLADASGPALSLGTIGYPSIAWIDTRDGRPTAYYQVLNAALSPLAANQPISSVMPEQMKDVATAARNGRAWFAWSDPRSNGFNIYAATDLFEPTDVGEDSQPGLPAGFTLSQNYPNPFNPSTHISFSLPASNRVSLGIYNSLGQRVRALIDSKLYPAGTHELVWDGHDDGGRSVASGVYFYRMKAGDQAATRKMLLLK